MTTNNDTATDTAARSMSFLHRMEEEELYLYLMRVMRSHTSQELAELPAESADLVTSRRGFAEPAHTTADLAEILRALKPGGRMVLEEADPLTSYLSPRHHSGIDLWAMLANWRAESHDKPTFNANCFRAGDLACLAAASGFQDTELREIRATVATEDQRHAMADAVRYTLIGPEMEEKVTSTPGLCWSASHFQAWRRELEQWKNDPLGLGCTGRAIITGVKPG